MKKICVIIFIICSSVYINNNCETLSESICKDNTEDIITKALNSPLFEQKLLQIQENFEHSILKRLDSILNHKMDACIMEVNANNNRVAIATLEEKIDELTRKIQVLESKERSSASRSTTSKIEQLKHNLQILEEIFWRGCNVAVFIVGAVVIYKVYQTVQGAITFLNELPTKILDSITNAPNNIKASIEDLKNEYQNDVAAGYDKGFYAWLALDPEKTLAGANAAALL